MFTRWEFYGGLHYETQFRFKTEPHHLILYNLTLHITTYYETLLIPGYVTPLVKPILFLSMHPDKNNYSKLSISHQS